MSLEQLWATGHNICALVFPQPMELIKQCAGLEKRVTPGFSHQLESYFFFLYVSGSAL